MRQFVFVGILVGLAIGAIGCASAPKGPTDVELVQAKTQECIATANTKNIEKLMTYFSDKFMSYEVGDKAALESFLANAKDSGLLDGLELDAKAAKTTVVQDKATVGPVLIKGGFGEGEAVFTAIKENGEWKISAMEVSGI
jgi:hypothetical protein